MARDEETELYRLLPCSLYDTQGVERWLEDLALEGLVLVKNSYARGRAAFRHTDPHTARYRLQAIPKRPAELVNRRAPGLGGRQAVWYAAGTMGEFYVYRSVDSDERDFRSDLLIQDMALARARRRILFDGILAALCLVLYPLIFLRGNLVLSLVEGGSWLYLLGAALLIWLLADSIRAYVRARQARRELIAQGRLKPREEPPRGNWYLAKNLAQLAAAGLFVVLVLFRWGMSLAGVGKIQRSDYQGEPPFATMADLCGGRADIYRVTLPKYSQVREWADPLSPRNLNWSESAAITLDSGEELAGGLYVDYHRTWSPFLAQCIAKGYLSRDGRGVQALAVSAQGADFVQAYYEDPEFPTVVFRKGNVTVRAMFYQTSSYELPLEEWVQTIVDSVGVSY